MLKEENICKAIEIYEKVFGKNDHYSNIETWKKRKLSNIFIREDNSFLVVEKRDNLIHIWLMGSLVKGNGTKLFLDLINSNSLENIEEITVSTFPKKWKIMYEWLQRIGFKEYQRVEEKIYLKVSTKQFIQYFEKTN
jgi:hypothetical protein